MLSQSISLYSLSPRVSDTFFLRAHGMKIALCAIKGNFPDFEKHFMPDWENWEYKVEVNLSLKTLQANDNTNTETGPPDDQLGQIFTLTLSLHHLVAIVRQNQILKYMLDSHFCSGKWHNAISVNNPTLQVIQKILEYLN